MFLFLYGEGIRERGGWKGSIRAVNFEFINKSCIRLYESKNMIKSFPWMFLIILLKREVFVGLKDQTNRRAHFLKYLCPLNNLIDHC
jgi:hypothetical protein